MRAGRNEKGRQETATAQFFLKSLDFLGRLGMAGDRTVAEGVSVELVRYPIDFSAKTLRRSLLSHTTTHTESWYE